eukprot:3689336-Lingulodinium_polyedra.AAC.1
MPPACPPRGPPCCRSAPGHGPRAQAGGPGEQGRAAGTAPPTARGLAGSARPSWCLRCRWHRRTPRPGGPGEVAAELATAGCEQWPRAL